MLKNDWLSVADTDIGAIRKINEDDFLNAPQIGLWCVADGMGGHQKGDLASSMIVDRLAEFNLPGNFPLTPNLVKEGLIEVNSSLLSIAAQSAPKTVIGSTVAVLLFDHSHAHCVWAGDSRIYRFRQNKLTRLTKDHSQIEEMLEAGLLSAEDAEHHPASNVITRAVGANSRLDLDVSSIARRQGDIYLLCSDGLNKIMPDDEIANILRTSPLSEAVEVFIGTALQRKVRDNVTVVLVADYAAQSEESIDKASLDATLALDETLPLKSN
ncbi:PP2C family protein-serine/threonine phosphatase [Paraglaciecola hydrolytica]|uniref:PP2C family protein-serine/threonine phosphatase n=1 Tax=Paraglaciecola hydrolytica TaxID=1799789 RepID=UPI000838D071|nr:protein phosphatase 2C domain-containing protein [Paraglaciecola hydrolytica]